MTVLEGNVFVTPFPWSRIQLWSQTWLLCFGNDTGTVTPYLRDKPTDIVPVLQKLRQTLLSSSFFIYCVP